MHFRNGAIAITYMATLLLQLQDRGLISVDDKLSKWFPDYPKADEITLAMLARSTTGYADYVNLDILPLYADVFRAWQPQELIDMGLKQEMKCAPGTCFAYAHTNYVILGEVFSKATGKDLASLLREYILDPLALRNTASDQTAAIPEPVQHAFDSERGFYEDSTYWNPSWTLANGAVMTTDIDDALTSIEAIGSGQLLSKAAFAEQIAPVTATLPPFSAATYYGMGLVITDGWMVQTPSFAGYAVTVGYDPERRIAIAVSVTSGPKSPESNVAKAIFGELGAYFRPDRPPIPPRPVSGG
jgi:CubicO group peptidase (beta-lactamase class C family)